MRQVGEFADDVVAGRVGDEEERVRERRGIPVAQAQFEPGAGKRHASRHGEGPVVTGAGCVTVELRREASSRCSG